MMLMYISGVIKILLFRYVSRVAMVSMLSFILEKYSHGWMGTAYHFIMAMSNSIYSASLYGLLRAVLSVHNI